MSLVIDGHNLIGSNVFPDIALTDVDDEARLAARLRVWKSRYAGSMTVIFDRGITAGRSANLSGGGVRVIFARNPEEADDLIRRRIRKGGKDLIVVTNDRVLREEAQAAGVQTWNGDEFIQRMSLPATPADQPEPGADPRLSLSAQEVAEWERVFQEQRNREELHWQPPPPKPPRSPQGWRPPPTRKSAQPGQSSPLRKGQGQQGKSHGKRRQK